MGCSLQQQNHGQVCRGCRTVAYNTPIKACAVQTLKREARRWQQGPPRASTCSRARGRDTIHADESHSHQNKSVFTKRSRRDYLISSRGTEKSHWGERWRWPPGALGVRSRSLEGGLEGRIAGMNGDDAPREATNMTDQRRMTAAVTAAAAHLGDRKSVV